MLHKICGLPQDQGRCAAYRQRLISHFFTTLSSARGLGHYGWYPERIRELLVPFWNITNAVPITRYSSEWIVLDLIILLLAMRWHVFSHLVTLDRRPRSDLYCFTCVCCEDAHQLGNPRLTRPDRQAPDPSLRCNSLPYSLAHWHFATHSATSANES